MSASKHQGNSWDNGGGTAPSPDGPATFSISDSGTVRMRRPDGSPLPNAEAAKLIRAHASAVRERLGAIAIADRERYQLRLAEHRLMRRIALKPDTLLPRFDSARPSEPLPPRIGWIDRLLGRTERHRNGYLQSLHTHRQALAAWRQSLAEHMTSTVKHRAVAVDLLAGAPDAIRTKLNTVLADLDWTLPISAQVDTVENDRASLLVAFPPKEIFPVILPATENTAGSAERESLGEAERHALSACLRIAAECFAEIPSLQAIHIHDAPPALSAVVRVYERHRWLTADFRLADHWNAALLDSQMRSL